MEAYEQLRAARAAGRPFPKLYESGVRYEREKRNADEWRTPREVLAAGRGDCEDLTAWRCAELWTAGVRNARPVIKQVRPGLKHAFIMVGDTKVDPSKKLGMKVRRRKAGG